MWTGILVPTEQYHIDALKKESGNNHGNDDLNYIDGLF